jgi:Ni/Co efflux regulator RcnB
MRVMYRLPLLPALLLFCCASFALAEGPLEDPVPPAVVGRPLEQINKPHPPARAKPAAKPVQPKAAARPAPAAQAARKPVPVPQAAAAGAARATPATQRPAKQAVDDRADPRMHLDDVGKGRHFARKPLGTGAYFGDRHRAAVLKYFHDHPASGRAARWQVGEPLPDGAPMAAVPTDLLSSLPQLPPGHRYLQVGGDVVLIAEGSKMVVDGISRSPR